MQSLKRTLSIAVVLALVVGGAAYARGDLEANVLNFALSGNPDTLDPHATAGTLTFQAVRSVYDTLAEPDADGRIVPALAESWVVSGDSLTWTFKLRRGVAFHNGDPFTSADVKATLERVRDPEMASSKAGEYEAIESIDTPDPYTVVIRLSEPYAPLLSTLASGWSAILPKSLIDAGHDFGSEPVGTGPFRFVEWVRDNRIVYEKNEDYWMSGYPKLDMVIMNIVGERSVQVQALLAGELDAIYNVNQEDVPMLERSPNVTVEKRLTALVMVMALNNSRPPLDDLRVRQAINHAIDKQTALDVAYGGGQVVGTFMDSGDPYYVDFTDLYPFDPARARSLLQQAGVDEDRVFQMVLPQNFEPHVRAGEIYHEMLKNVGLNVELRLVDWPTWLSDVYRGGNYDFTVIGHTGKLDPDGRLGGYGTDRTYVRWVNPEAAQLFDRASKTVGFENRQPLYARGLEIMAREVPFVFVGTSYRYVATRSIVSGFIMDQKLDTFDFRYTRKQ